MACPPLACGEIALSAATSDDPANDGGEFALPFRTDLAHQRFSFDVVAARAMHDKLEHGSVKPPRRLIREALADLRPLAARYAAIRYRFATPTILAASEEQEGDADNGRHSQHGRYHHAASNESSAAFSPALSLGIAHALKGGRRSAHRGELFLHRQVFHDLLRLGVLSLCLQNHRAPDILVDRLLGLVGDALARLLGFTAVDALFHNRGLAARPAASAKQQSRRGCGQNDPHHESPQVVIHRPIAAAVRPRL
jgi:hypothetical protein